MIINPNQNEKLRGADGADWVSASWVKKQTATPSTNGWTEAVLNEVRDTLGGRWKIHKGEVYYKLDDILEAFKRLAP